jgi:protein phosphatase 2C
MASDGLWDVLSNEAAAEVAARALAVCEGRSMQHVADSLVQAALSFGSRDNVTAVVVDLRHASASD